MSGEYSGRFEGVGLGIEATAGTPVAPQVFVRHLSSNFVPKQTTIENDSAMGRVERVNESALDTRWNEGPLMGKVADISFGYLLSGFFGLPVTTDNADSNPAVKDHTFNFAQSNTPKYLTVTVKTPVADRRHALGVIDTLKITGERGKFVQFTAGMKAKVGVPSSDTVAYLLGENEFTMNHVGFRFANNVASVSSASPLDIKKFEVNMERKTKPFFAALSPDPSAFNSGDVDVTGEFVVRYNSTTHEDNYLSNVAQALQLSIINTDVTIGAAAHPGLVLTAPQTRLSDFGRSDDLSDIVEATIGFRMELSAADAYMLRAVLTNTQPAYIAA